MNWLNEFQLFLFDFDGLLVNTEEIHHKAYIRMCAQRGFTLDWDFSYYCSIAHYSSSGLEEQIYNTFPDLKKIEPRWDILYAEKKQAFLDLIHEGHVGLMPYAEEVLLLLAKEKVQRCVVTHSASQLIARIREQNPILNTIEHWITREHYSQPKPHPECYLKTISLLAKDHEKVIGFEDTPRGINALLGTRAKPVLICSTNFPEIPYFLNHNVLHYPSLKNIYQKLRNDN
jgi:HAD superfamily hydrolase (TIGR01509 family)